MTLGSRLMSWDYKAPPRVPQPPAPQRVKDFEAPIACFSRGTKASTLFAFGLEDGSVVLFDLSSGKTTKAGAPVPACPPVRG